MLAGLVENKGVSFREADVVTACAPGALFPDIRRANRGRLLRRVLRTAHIVRPRRASLLTPRFALLLPKLHGNSRIESLILAPVQVARRNLVLH